MDQVLGNSYLSDQYKTYANDLKTCLRTGRTNDQSCEHYRKSVYEDVCNLLDHPNFSDIFNSDFSQNPLVPYVKSVYAASVRIVIYRKEPCHTVLLIDLLCDIPYVTYHI